MKYRLLIQCLLGLAGWPVAGCAQVFTRYNAFSYNVNEGLLQSAVTDMAFDQNNICWLSFANGIQRFDGKNITNVPVQPGLPDDKGTAFFTCTNGDLLVAHSSGISRYDVYRNKFFPVYQQASSMHPLFIGEDEGIIYFLSFPGTITGMDASSFAIRSRVALPFSPQQPEAFRFSDKITGHRTALYINNTLALWDLQQGMLLQQSAPLPDLSIFFLSLASPDEALYYEPDKDGSISLRAYHFNDKKSRTIFTNNRTEAKAFRSLLFTWQGKALLSYYNNLYEVEQGTGVIRSELVNFMNLPIAGKAVIARIKQDRLGNLYLITINDGIRKIISNNYPIRYFGAASKDESYTISLLPDKQNNRILAGTYGSGLLVFDTSQHLIKHIRNLPGKTAGFSPVAVIKNNDGDYILFISGDTEAWLLSRDLSRFKRLPVNAPPELAKAGINYYGTFLFQDHHTAIVGITNWVYKIDTDRNRIISYKIGDGMILGSLFMDNRIITHTNDEILFLDAATFKERGRAALKNTGGVRCFARGGKNRIYVGSNKGIFAVDTNGKVLQHWDKQKGLPDECIYAMSTDGNGALWCSTNKGLFKLNPDNSILHLKKENGLQENEFNTNIVAQTGDGELFFGGVNGISSFYPAAINGFNEKVSLLVTGIKVNNEEAFKDTAVWTIHRIELPYNQNSLSFDFIAMAGNNPDQYVYQYKMEGIDRQWIQSSSLQTARYLLPPGEYTFKIYAARFFDKNAQPLKEIIIIIRPPFWRTWWFGGGFLLLFTLLLIFSINQYNRRKYRRKMSVLESEHKIQLERERISRDLHDNIGAYANVVLYNTELLEKETSPNSRSGLMTDLKFASKDIITALRETVWALKQDQYPAQDCLLRIRNFIHPFNRYYRHISFTVEGAAPEGQSLHSTHALNLVRIVQEAVTNAIKHADAHSIHVSSAVENNSWQLTVADDGKGFEYANADKHPTGNGLHNMRQRAADSGFGFSVQSQPVKGTAITVQIPFSSTNHL